MGKQNNNKGQVQPPSKIPDSVLNTPVNNDRLSKFSQMDESSMHEGTASYHKWKTPGEKVDALFMGIESRNLDSNNPEKLTDCAILTKADGERLIMAQTVIVKELKKKWNETGEIEFPVRIIYKGEVGEGADKYQSFRLLFE